MKNNKGVTLISLITSVVLLIIIAGLTISTSVSSFNQMKFEGKKSEIEEMQKLVDEIATDYQTYLLERHSGNNEYVDYFKVRYGVDFSSKLLLQSSNLDLARNVISKYPDLAKPGNNVFLFKSNDISKNFDLKGINDVIVDFSTRTVYSVEGIKDPSDKNVIYYTQSDWKNDPKITYTPPITVTQGPKTGTTFEFKINSSSKNLNNISEVYSVYINSSNVVTTTKINPTSKSATEIKVNVTGEGIYKFRLVDSSKNIYETEEIETN